jgi:hypothetical protein
MIEQYETLSKSLRDGWKTFTMPEFIDAVLVYFAEDGITREQLELAAEEWSHRVQDQGKRTDKASLLLKLSSRQSTSREAMKEHHEMLSKCCCMTADILVEQRAEWEAGGRIGEPLMQ